MTVAPYTRPNNTAQSASQYKANIDGGFQAFERLAGAFAPHAQSSPNMTVRVDAGQLLSGTTLTEVAAQSTGSIIAPGSNSRIDRVVIDSTTGTVSVITGTPGVSPAVPALTTGKLPVCQVLLTSASTSITNSMITDERIAGGASRAPIPPAASTTKTDTYTSTSTSATDITGMSVSVTTQSAAEQVLVRFVLMCNNGKANDAANVLLLRGSTQIGMGDAASSRTRATSGLPLGHTDDGAAAYCVVGEFLDSPGAAGTYTYKLQHKIGAGTFQVNRTPDDTDTATYGRFASTITAQRIDNS